MITTKLENRKAKIDFHPGRPVKDFTDLDAWKRARELRVVVYKLSSQFPTEERHTLTAQIRRAAISVTANLAEGYGRYSYQENSQFCRHSRASAYEVRDHLITALDQGCISQKAWKDAEELAKRVIFGPRRSCARKAQKDRAVLPFPFFAFRFSLFVPHGRSR